MLTSTYQMAVLIQYNKHATLSLKDLSSATSLSVNVLKQVLETLTRSHVLIKDMGDVYHLNLSALSPANVSLSSFILSYF